MLPHLSEPCTSDGTAFVSPRINCVTAKIEGGYESSHFGDLNDESCNQDEIEDLESTIGSNYEQYLLLNENSGSGTNISVRLPRLTSTIDLIDIRFCKFQDRSHCSNCYEKVIRGHRRHGKKFSDVLCSKTSMWTQGKVDVTVLEALDVIFELKKKSCLSKVILDEMEYSLCQRCCSALTKLFQFYLEFTDCCMSPSFLDANLTQNKSLNLYNQTIRGFHHDSDEWPIHDAQRDELDLKPSDQYYVSSPSIGELRLNDSGTEEMEPFREQTVRNLERNTTFAEEPKKHDSRNEDNRPLPYKCLECSALFSRPSRLRRHLVVHSDKKYVCRICGAGFKFSVYLNRHLAMQHVAGTDPGNLQINNRKLGIGQTNFKRKRRDNFSTLSSKWGVNRQRISDRRIEHRNACVLETTKKVGRPKTRHLSNAHKENLKFRKNTKNRDMFSRVKNVTVRDNENQFDQTLPHQEQEDLQFKQENECEINTTISKIRNTEKICSELECSFTYTRTSQLKQHLQRVHNLERGQTTKSKRIRVTNSILKSKRLATRRPKPSPVPLNKNYECDICEKKYKDAATLKNHTACHTLAKPFICDKCGFATKRAYQLSRHVEMVHIGTRSHHCKECNLSFKKKQHLLDHAMTHKTLEYRPYACTVEGCTKAYRSKRNLRQHLEAHENCKFQCETCGRIFTRKDNLKVHVDTVHLGKPGRSQKQKPKESGESSLSVTKSIRNRKEVNEENGILGSRLVTMENVTLMEEQASLGHQLIVVGDPGTFLEIQQAPKQFHVITDPRIIQDGQISSQNVLTITNSVGEFFYTL